MDFTKNSGTAAGVIGAAAMLLAVFSTFSHAQVRPDAGTILEGTKQPAIAPRPGVDVLPRVADPRPALGAPGLKVNVTGFKITGNTLFSEAVLLPTVQEFIGKEQNIDGLNDAATKVRAYYRERGYFLAQAYLPQQEIKDGVIEIAVIEARIGKVALDFKAGTRYSEGLIRGIIEHHLHEGDIITENELETPLLLLNDFPNAIVTSEIKPSQTIGAADLTIHVSDAPGWINGSVDIDNHGNRFTGAIRAGISVNINSPLAIGDQLSYRGFVTDDRMGFYRVAYVIPFGHLGTRVGVSYASFHYRLGKQFIDSLNHGTGGITTLYAFHPLMRTRSSNLILQYANEAKRLDDRDEVAGTIIDRKIVSNKLGLVGDFRDGLLGGGLNSYSYTTTVGYNQLGPDPILIGDQSAAGANTAGRFAKQNFEFRRLQKVTDSTTLLLAVSGQMASKNLTSAEKFSLGGADGVRAYPSGEALGDTGYVFQGELRYLIPGFKIGSGDVTLSGFYDQGWVQIQENFVNPPAGLTAANANNRRLNGYGVGGSVGKDADFVVRASFAWRLENELPTSDTAKRIPRVWVQGIKWF
ncbi:MAG: ShlB/FhaC/HecB family hemolysin secretion/activation protein [Pseudomonadota bacterium]